jgi:hypothetical protein
LATKRHKKHKEKLTTDFTDDTDLIGHKKAQKARRKINHEFTQIDTDFLV